MTKLFEGFGGRRGRRGRRGGGEALVGGVAAEGGEGGLVAGEAVGPVVVGAECAAAAGQFLVQPGQHVALRLGVVHLRHRAPPGQLEGLVQLARQPAVPLVQLPAQHHDVHDREDPGRLEVRPLGRAAVLEEPPQPALVVRPRRTRGAGPSGRTSPPPEGRGGAATPPRPGSSVAEAEGAVVAATGEAQIQGHGRSLRRRSSATPGDVCRRSPAAAGCPVTSEIEFSTPEALPTPAGYSHVVSIPAGTRFVWTSGQVPLEADGTPAAPGDWAAQTRLALRDVGTALEAAGATWGDVVKLTWYVTDTSALTTIRSVRDEFVDVRRPPTSTLVQVAGLFRPDILIEVEAVAAVTQ
ncbi:MAG: hypothetical protein GEV11_12560 [Streptosporangiales bacterium]|nr:hypothetical protein [Streptosporangiales bacterium]